MHVPIVCVCMQVDDRTQLDAHAFVGLRDKGYAGGLVWAYYEVAEAPGGSLTAPRVIVLHEQWRAYAHVMSRVKAELGE